MTSSTSTGNSTFDLVKQSIQTVLKSRSPLRAIEQALVSFDFGIKSERQSLMQVCFSPMAGILSVLVLVLLMLSPLRYHFSVMSIVGLENPALLILYKTDIQSQVMFFVLGLVLGTWIRWDYLVLGIIGFFLSNGDLHLVLAHSALWGLLFSQIRRQLKWLSPSMGQLEPHIRSILIWICSLQILGFVAYAFMSFNLYLILQNFGYFSASMKVNRMEFLILSLCLFYALQFSVLSLWGHFYSKRQKEPSKWNVKYSTVYLLPQMHLNQLFQKEFETKVIDLYKARVQKKSESPATASTPETENANILKVMPKRLLELNGRELENIAIAHDMVKS